MSTEEGQATTPKSKPAEAQAGGAHADAGLSHEQLLLPLQYALERFVNELLPVKDSLELGRAAAGEGADVAKLREGIELTLKMLAAALEKFGVKTINPTGEKFNPDLH